MKKLLLAGAALAALIGGAVAQSGTMGMFSNLPPMGAQICTSYVNGVCVQTVGPGESALTGNERIPNDTMLPGGQSPQTQTLTVNNLSQFGQGSERNSLIGGDFFINLWQGGTTPLSAATPTTTTISADGWGVYSSGNTVTVAKDTTAADLSPTLGINAAMKITRPSGTNTTAICVSQVLAQKESERYIGREAVFSFYANPLSGYLATNKQIIATVAVYTAADSATPGTNTDAFAKGTITGYTVINPTSATVTTAPAINLATGWNRYSVAGAVPTTVSSNPVIGIGVQICTPVYPASTGVAGDGFLLANLQLEETTPGTTVSMTGPGTSTFGVNNQTVTLAPANTTPGGFAHRTPFAEAALEYSYRYVLTDGAATIYYYPGIATTNALAKVLVTFPVPMRETPALTVGTTISFAVTKSDGTAQACGTSIAAVSSSATPFQQTLLCTTGATALTAGNVANLMGAATGGILTWSAYP